MHKRAPWDRRLGTIASQDWVNMIAEQATLNTLENGRGILLIVGYCPPDRALHATRPFWKCGLGTPRILLNLIDHPGQWEEGLSEIQQTSTENLVEESHLPFVNLHPMGDADETGCEPAISVLRSYLQVVQPLIVVSMGYKVCPRISASDSFELTC